MRFRIGGTDNREGDGYYIREEVELEQALDDGFSVFKGTDGWYYFRPTSRCHWRGWLGRPVQASASATQPELP